MCVCVCERESVCVCVWTRKKERERGIGILWINSKCGECVCARVCVYVCVRDWVRKRGSIETEREGVREEETWQTSVSFYVKSKSVQWKTRLNFYVHSSELKKMLLAITLVKFIVTMVFKIICLKSLNFVEKKHLCNCHVGLTGVLFLWLKKRTLFILLS